MTTTTDLAIYVAKDAKAWPAIASDGKGYLVVWSATGGVRGRLVDQNGKLGAWPISISSSNGYEAPAVSYDGTDYFVAWQYGKEILGRKVSTSGVVLGTANIKISSDSTNNKNRVEAIFNGKEHLVVWEDAKSFYNHDVHGRLVSKAGIPQGSAHLIISNASDHQQYTGVASDGKDFLVVWADYRNKATNATIAGARVQGSPSAKVLDLQGLPIRITNVKYTQPTVAYGGGKYLVTWQESKSGMHIFGTRMLSSGALQDSTPFQISTHSDHQYYPSAAWGGTNFLVAWGDYRPGNGVKSIYAARVVP